MKNTFPFHLIQLKSCLASKLIKSILLKNKMASLVFIYWLIFWSCRACGWSSLSFSLQRWWKSGSCQAQTLLLGHSEQVSSHINKEGSSTMCWEGLMCILCYTGRSRNLQRDPQWLDWCGLFYEIFTLVSESSCPLTGFNLYCKSYSEISDGVILQVGAGLHFTQVHLSSDQAIWERANSQSEHVLVSVESERLTFASCYHHPHQFVFCQSPGSFLNCCGGITSGLWLSNMEPSCFKSTVKFLPNCWDSINPSVNLKRLCLRSSGQVCFLEKGHEAF